MPLLWRYDGLSEHHLVLTFCSSPPLPFTCSFIQDRAGRMAGETPELTLEQPPQDPSTKKLSECLRRIGDELDSNMELQRCASWDLGSVKGVSCHPRSHALGTFFSQGTRCPSLNSERIQGLFTWWASPLPLSCTPCLVGVRQVFWAMLSVSCSWMLGRCFTVEPYLQLVMTGSSRRCSATRLCLQHLTGDC